MQYNDDTIKLLKECSAGSKMGIKSLESLVEKIESPKMQQQVLKSIKKHKDIEDATRVALLEAGETDKEASPMAEAMSWLKTNFKMAVDSSDSEIAELLIDGCNMGIKSVSRYLNKYSMADKSIKSMVDDLIKLEQKLMDELRFYLN